MARTFPSGDKIRCSPGAAAGITGAVTLAVICQTAASRDAQWRALLSSLTAGGAHTAGYNIELNNSNKMVLGSDGGAFGAAPTTTTVAADGWCLHVETKASGTVAPQYNRYKYSTNVFVLGEAHASTETNATAGGLIEIGGDFGGSSDFFVGDIAIAAMWDRVLSAAEIQNLPFTLQAWYASAPKGLWLLDQAAVAQLVGDLTGNGANQSAITGTTISTTAHVPIFNYTDGIWLPNGVASAAASGEIDPVGIASAAAVGTPQVKRQIGPTGIATGQAVGTPSIRIVWAQGIASAQATGTPQAHRQLGTVGISTAAAVGTPQDKRQIGAVGIASAAQVGTDQAHRQIGAVGIASQAAVGQPTLANVFFVTAIGIPSAAAVGTPQLHRRLGAVGIASTATVGAPQMLRQLGAVGIASTAAVGTPQAKHQLGCVGIASSATVGTPFFRRITQVGGIPSGEFVSINTQVGVPPAGPTQSLATDTLLSAHVTFDTRLSDRGHFQIAASDRLRGDTELSDEPGGQP